MIVFPYLFHHICKEKDEHTWNIAGLHYDKNKLYPKFMVHISYTLDPVNKLCTGSLMTHHPHFKAKIYN
jgi:hypothetical protein